MRVICGQENSAGIIVARVAVEPQRYSVSGRYHHSHEQHGWEEWEHS
jgi:hypothetical protein